LPHLNAKSLQDLIYYYSLNNHELGMRFVHTEFFDKLLVKAESIFNQ